MISIQSAMLVALGFLAASLLALLIAPAFWARAVRLTSQRIKDAMPLTELEIRADKDRLRAEYAIKVHRLESQMEQVRLAGSRQQIELNRRDARINEIEAELERLTAQHEETQNARRVLEQTVADRLPRVERRLGEAKQLIHTRDQELGELTRTSDRQSQALGEAQAINAQQRSEIERLEAALAARTARNQDGLADPRFDGEVALRSEIESLRAKTREQAQLLQRLQSMAGRPGAQPPASADQGVVGAVIAAVGAGEAAAVALNADAERQIRTLRARTEDQAGEIARLKAALAVFESEADADPRVSLRESRIGLKARVQSLEAQNNQLTDTLQRVRSELAAANERAARQAAHFTTELKRLGAGTLPASGPARRVAEPQRLTLAERVAQARGNAVTGGRPGASRTGPADDAAAGSPLPVAADERANGAMRAAKVVAVTGAAVAEEGGAELSGMAALEANGAAGNAAVPHGDDAGAAAVRAGEAEKPAAEVATRDGRPRLLDRIASAGRSS